MLPQVVSKSRLGRKIGLQFLIGKIKTFPGSFLQQLYGLNLNAQYPKKQYCKKLDTFGSKF